MATLPVVNAILLGILLLLAVITLVLVVVWPKWDTFVSAYDRTEYRRVWFDLAELRATIPNEPYPEELTDASVYKETPPSRYRDREDVLIRGLAYAINNPGTDRADSVVRLVERYIVDLALTVTTVSPSDTAPAYPAREDDIVALAVRRLYGTLAGVRGATLGAAGTTRIGDDSRDLYRTTTLLGHYLLVPSPAAVEAACAAIFALYPEPGRSWKVDLLDDTMALVSAGPHLLARYFARDLSVFDTARYSAVRTLCHVEPKALVGADGYHLDGAYLWEHRLAFDVLCDLAARQRYVLAMNRVALDRVDRKWHHVRNIILHPTIALQPMGITGSRRFDFAADINGAAPYGVKVIPGAGYLRYFTADYSFAVRAQTPWLLPGPNATMDMPEYQQYTQFRCVFSTAEAPVEDPTHRTGIPGSFKTVTASSETRYTHPRNTAARSAVFAYGQYGIMRQLYSSPEAALGTEWVTVLEMIVIDTDARTVTIERELLSKEELKLTHGLAGPIADYRSGHTVTDIPANTIHRSRTVFDLQAGTVAMSTPNAPLAVDNLRLDINQGVLYDADVPKLACPVTGDTTGGPTLSVPSVGRFVFDESINQYRYAGKWIE